VETIAPQVALESPTGASPGDADVVVVLDEDLAPPPPTGDHDVAMTSMSEPSPSAKVPEPSPAAAVAEPSPAVGAAETSSATVDDSKSCSISPQAYG
jgi:hypothetical protein